MDIRRRREINYFLIVLVILVVLCSSLVFSTISWLQETYTRSDNNVNIGKIDVCLYANNTKITGTIGEDGKWTCDTPYEITAGSTIRTLNLKMRNEGTIDALVRVTVNVYFMENANKRTALIVSTTPTVDGTITLDTTGWIKQFPSENVACGYMFYNSKLPSYYTKTTQEDGSITSGTNTDGEVSIINQIMVSNDQKDTPFYVDVNIDAVSYSGNVYKKIEGKTSSEITALVGSDDLPVLALPFGKLETLPDEWTAWR